LERLGNGDLLTAAELAGFEVFLTTDKNLRHQQNMAGRTIAVSSSAFSNGQPFNRTSRSWWPP
jgi:hypothetical protein